VISARPPAPPKTPIKKNLLKTVEIRASLGTPRTARARDPPTRQLCRPAHPRSPHNRRATSPAPRVHAAAQPHRGARPVRRHRAPPQQGGAGRRGQGPPGVREGGDGRGGGGRRGHVEAARVVLVGGRGGGPAAAPAPGALRVRPPALHGRRVHHPHGQPGRAAAGPGLRRHAGHARRRRRAALAQLAPRRAQHGQRLFPAYLTVWFFSAAASPAELGSMHLCCVSVLSSGTCLERILILVHFCCHF
jgi:hypothetical protein